MVERIHGNTGLIGTSTIKSICNDPAGLAVYAVGYTNDTYGNNNLSSTVGASTINIATAVTPSGTPAQSEWNMTLAAVSGDYAPTITTGYDSAHIIPNVYTKVAYRNTMTDIGTSATGAQFTASFNAYIAPTQAAGTYTGKVKFLLVHPNVLTWQEDSQNTGTIIPEEVQPATIACDPEAPSLQNVASWGSSVALGETVEAMDSRDCQTYKVRRLKMNAAGTETALWMSNLNLGAQALAVTQLDDTNSNLAPGASAIPASTFASWDRVTSGNTRSYTNPKFTPLTTTSAQNYQAEDAYGNKYGTLYNYAAASANTYVYEKGSGSGNATSDLCPTGWRMPTGGNAGEHQALITAYSLTNNAQGATALQEDLGFSLAGDFDDYSPALQGRSGIYWSSTFVTSSYMRGFAFNSTSYSTAQNTYRGDGLSIRCINQ